MRKPASVHIDIADFAMTVLDTPKEERAEWLLSLAKSLSYADPSLNPYGAKLLSEVENYRESERLRKSQYKDSSDGKGKTRKDEERHGKTVFPLKERQTVSKTEQKERKTISKEDITPDGLSFDFAWSLYDRPGSNKKLSKQRWDKLSDDQKELAIQHIPAYNDCHDDKKYQRTFEVYISRETWNDDLPIFKDADDDEYEKRRKRIMELPIP